MGITPKAKVRLLLLELLLETSTEETENTVSNLVNEGEARLRRFLENFVNPQEIDSFVIPGETLPEAYMRGVFCPKCPAFKNNCSLKPALNAREVPEGR